MTQWNPVTTIPMDGTIVIVCLPMNQGKSSMRYMFDIVYWEDNYPCDGIVDSIKCWVSCSDGQISHLSWGENSELIGCGKDQEIGWWMPVTNPPEIASKVHAMCLVSN